MLKLSHKRLDVYQIALRLVKKLYEVTGKFPMDERYVLVQQLKRAAISVCSNIAEGASRNSKPEKKRFYEIARGSVVEVDTQLEIALLLKLLALDDIKELEQYIESIFRMLSKMIDTIQTPLATSQKPLAP
jgi:four helix bundle protein